MDVVLDVHLTERILSVRKDVEGYEVPGTHGCCHLFIIVARAIAFFTRKVVWIKKRLKLAGCLRFLPTRSPTSDKLITQCLLSINPHQATNPRDISLVAR